MTDKESGAFYKSRMLYFNLIKSFLSGDINGSDFAIRFFRQRSADMEVDEESGYSSNYKMMVSQRTKNERLFNEKCCSKLCIISPTYDENYTLMQFLEDAKRYHISGPMFFNGLYERIFDCAEGMDDWLDEKQLRNKLTDLFEFLASNPEIWS